MTFYEAAVEVLREAGRALHYKKITEQALKRELLTHTGKSPDVIMQARLKAELRKGPEQTLLREVRPGVFELKRGGDLDMARESVPLRVQQEPEEIEDEDLEALDDIVEEPEPKVALVGHGDTDEADENGEGDEADENGDDEGERGGGKRRRRGRRGGRNRERDRRDETDDAASEESPRDESPTEAPLPRVAAAQTKAAVTAAATPTSPPAPQPQRSEPAATRRGVIEGLEEAGELARLLVQVIEEEAKQGPSVSQRQLASALSRRGFGGASRLSPARIRAALEEANRRRAATGWPPLFVETKPERWALAEASGQELAASYGALQRWQAQHRALLTKTLAARLHRLDGDAIAAVLTLLLERLGYRDIRQHEPGDREHSTLSARQAQGLAQSRIAVRIASPTQRLSRSDVQNFRGSLHLYGADDAVVIAVAGVDETASHEAEVPNLATISLYDANDLAQHLIRAGIGVGSFRVDVSCIDETFFRDFEGDGN